MARLFTSVRCGAPPAPAGSVFAAAAAIPVQAKLTVGAPNDRYEREADQVASQVVGFLHAPAVSEPAPQGAIQRQISPVVVGAVDLVQECDCCGGTCGTTEEPEMSHSEDVGTRLQRASEGGVEVSTPAPETIESRLQRARDGGEPFAPSVRQPMEKAFGADFSGVTIHRDHSAHELNHTLQARAFTTGQDIFFRRGEYAPASRRGQELIAHELTHVVQQSGGKLSQAQPPGTGVLQRACTRAECGPDPDPRDEPEGREIEMLIQEKPLTGHSFLSAAAVSAGSENPRVQRCTVAGDLDNAAATPNALGAAVGAFADKYGATATNNTATSMRAEWLHRQAAGTGVGGRRPDHWLVFKGLAGGLNPFCQGHFLSQKLGGKGAYDNLSPFTRSLNGTHESRVESEVIDWTKQTGRDKWAQYAVDAHYNGNADVENWALGKFAAMSAAKQIAAANNIPGKGPFATAAKAAAAANKWIPQYVQDTFPSDIDCFVKFIRFKMGQYRATNWQNVNLTNEF